MTIDTDTARLHLSYRPSHGLPLAMALSLPLWLLIIRALMLV